MKKFLQRILSAFLSYSWGILALAVLLFISGILLLAAPLKSANTVLRVIGILTAVFGLLSLLDAISKRNRKMRFLGQFLFAICAFFSAIPLLIVPSASLNIFIALAGLLLVIDGSFKLRTVLDARYYKGALWWMLLPFPLLTIAGGFFALRVSEIDAALLILGGALIACSIANVIATFVAPSLEKHRRMMYTAQHNTSSAESKADTLDKIDTKDISPEAEETQSKDSSVNENSEPEQ